MTTLTAPTEPAALLPRPLGRRRRTWFRASLLVAAIGMAVPGTLLMRPWLDGNVGVVDPGLVIRSAQPTAQLVQLINDHRLQSILNLRGGSARDPWYVAEVQAAEANGVQFFDLPLNATRRPTRRELLHLIDVLERCTYPLLIHCKAGADRTGLASAIYLMQHRGESPDQAARSFTLLHSHVPLLGTQHLHEPLDEYARWLASRNVGHSAQRFRDWVRNDYESDDPHVDPPPLAPGPRRPM